ncbi:MAG: SBBP repeat-containing protein [Anaerolineales bacterium]|nr:SBBP repeat-containing protein [Anaerolineales bacterium]
MPTLPARKMGQVLCLTGLVFVCIVIGSNSLPLPALAQQGNASIETATLPPTLPVEIEEPTVTPTPAATLEATAEPTVTPLPAEIIEPGPSVSLPAIPVEDRALSGPPLLFVENVGQFPTATNGEIVRFQASGQPASLSLTDSALWFTLLEPTQPDAQAQSLDEQQTPPALPQRGLILKVSFINANPQPRIEPFQRLDPTISYFTGSDPAQWRTDVPVWAGIRYLDLYPGLDLEITSDNGQLVQRLVAKGGDVAAQAMTDVSLLAGIRLQVEGAEAAALDGAGGLHLATALGDVTLPLLQAVTADGVPVDLSTATPEVNGLEVVSPFSPAPLPVLSEVEGPPSSPAQAAATSDLIYSTFIGSNIYFDSSEDIAVDSTGSAYITGRAYTTFPTTPGVFDPTIEGFFNDAFVAKLTPDGSGLVYATFLGGDSYAETGFAIAIDGAGNAYVTGYTVSTDFPTTPGGFDHDLSGNHDGFVAKLNPNGTALLYSSFLGGNAEDYGYDIALDSSGQAYVTGFTRSTDLPTTPGAFAPSYNGGFSDGYAVKVAADGSALTYATYLGGSADESSDGIAVDSTGSAYVTGYTSSPDFPTTPGAWDTSMAVADAFVLKLNPAGSGLVYSTFLGGSFAEGGRAVALDSLGSAYITGRTDSPDFPATPDAFDTSHSSANDIFVAKLTPDGGGLLYATYLGGNNEEDGRDLAVDTAGSVYITGFTGASDFPTTPNAYAPICQGCAPYFEAFVAKLNPNGTGLVYATYLGGANHDYSYGLAQDNNGYVYVTGETQSPDFPTTPGAFDTTLSGLGSGFVSKLFVGTGTGTPPPPLPAQTCAPTLLDTFTVQNEPRGLALDSTRQRLYVANFGSDSVSAVDTGNDNVLQTIPGIDSANSLAYDATHNLIWVTNYQTGQVTPIQANGDASSFSVLPPLAVGAGPWGVAYDPIHDFIYVANSLDNSVTVISAASRSVVATLSNNFNQPFHLAANPVTGKVYVSNFGSASVTVLNGPAVSRVVSLYDSSQPYGIAIDETRNLVYVATVGPHRIVALGPIRGVPDQFLGWAAFNRGFGNPRRPVPLRAIAVNPALGPAGDGGHLWTTTSTSDGSETNQALFIPKGWGGYFHIPLVQNVGAKPGEGIAIDRLTNRIYIASGAGLGTVTVLGDHTAICSGAAPASVTEDADQINLELFPAVDQTSRDVTGDGQVNILDLTFIAAHYGSNDPAADINADGRVNILDLVLVAGGYGQEEGITD